MLIHFVRHGITETPDRLCGRTDVAATLEGNAAVIRRLEALAPKTLIASPRRRARLPAATYADRTGIELQVDDAFAEIDVGDWENRAFEELRASEGERFAAYIDAPEDHDAPGGERWSDFSDRLETRLRSLLVSGDLAHDPAVVVCHAGVIRATLARACGWRAKQTWGVAVGFASTMTLQLGLDEAHGLWGQLVGLQQAPDEVA
ncbi:MAG: histidine phosphatase family protein [Pseudomonadota bacterium]